MNANQRTGETILVVDDSRPYLRLLTRLLGGRGYRVLQADNGEAALLAVAAAPPDLILLDIKMPGMDGYQVCSELKAQPQSRDIPVIFISGADQPVDKVKAFTCGGVDYIAKPFDDAEVLARVDTHLQLRALQRRLEERVRARTAELSRAEELFRGVLESAPEAMLITDHVRRIVLVNSQAEALFGYGREELAGQPIEALMPERFRDEHARLAAGYLAAPRTRPMGSGLELFGRRRDGSEFPAEISLSPLRGSDGSLLVIGSIRDISVRRQVENELVESRERLRELAAYHEAVRERERKRIALEIHDELGSLLTALKMDISLLRMSIGEHDPQQELIGQMRELIEKTIGMVRHVATQLRPTALNLGIQPALEWLLEDFSRRTGLAYALDVGAEVEMNDAQATAAFRIVQESLTNVARHARAGWVGVTLTATDQGIELRIRDDGRGFDPEAAAGGSFGLLGIRERAVLLGGTAEIDSAPERGTAVIVRIPREAR